MNSSLLYQLPVLLRLDEIWNNSLSDYIKIDLADPFKFTMTFYTLVICLFMTLYYLHREIENVKVFNQNITFRNWMQKGRKEKNKKQNLYEIHTCIEIKIFNNFFISYSVKTLDPSHFFLFLHVTLHEAIY